jgi:hypothetical protein
MATDSAKINDVDKGYRQAGTLAPQFLGIIACRLRLQVWLPAFAQSVPACGMEFQD